MINHQSENTVRVYLKAILLGSIGAFIGGLVWYLSIILTKWQVGIFAILVGLAVGVMTSIGGGIVRLRSIQLISITLTLISLFFSEYFIIHHYAVLRFPTEIVPLFIPFGRMVSLVFEVIIRFTPLTLVFWLIAIYEAYIIPKKMFQSSIQKYHQINT